MLPDKANDSMPVAKHLEQIVLVYDGDVESALFNEDARDNCLQPEIVLRDEALRSGFEMVGADGEPSEKAVRIVHWDATIAAVLLRERHTLRGRLGALSRRLRGRTPAWHAYAEVPWDDERVVLILIEPPAANPSSYDQRLLRQFHTVLTWDDELVDGARFQKYYLPLPDAPAVPADRVPFAAKRLCATISANKFSDHPAELYSTRRKSIRYFEQRYPGQFDLFGVGWGESSTHPSASAADRSPYPSYRGTVECKTDTLKNYRFALCYENTDGPRGYVSEKIFDCLRADCVPVYLGAPNIGDYVDDAAFIDRRQFPSDEALAQFLESMEEQEYMAYRLAALRYLESEGFKRFLPDAFASTVLGALRIHGPAPVTPGRMQPQT